MKSINLSQRLNARMQFKSLLLLSLLAGGASAQTPMPSVPFEAFNAGAPTPTLTNTDVEAERSTWTLRQHASWLLGFKTRRGSSCAPGGSCENSVQPCVVEAPHPDIVSTAPLFSAPDMPAQEIPTPTLTAPTLTAQEISVPNVEPTMLMLPEVPADAIALVQHTEPIPQPSAPALAQQPTTVTTAGHAQDGGGEVAHAHIAPPPGLNLGPVVAGPVPPLPLEQLGASLLQVDVSGVDVSRIEPTSQPGGSLIDALGFRPPTGFSMRDSEPSSVAASPARAKPVSIHEGFTPRPTMSNQATELNGTESVATPTDRLSMSLPGASHFSMSDKSQSSSGPVFNRFSDKVSHEQTSDRAKSPASPTAGKAIEKSFSDKGTLLSSVPVEVAGGSDKTSRSGKPIELTPPERLAKDSKHALPLAAVAPVASTGIDSQLPRKSDDIANPSKPPVSDKPQVSQTQVAAAAPTGDKASDKPTLSLIEGFVSPSLLTATEPKTLTGEPTVKENKNNDAAAKDSGKKDTSTVATLQPVEKPTQPKLLGDSTASPSHPGSQGVIAKADQPKTAERITLSDFNPIALKRPVIKAANVALPAPAEADSVVVQSSHEVDEATQQTAEYAKLANKLQQAVKQKFPGVRVKISANEDGLIVDGNVTNNAEATKVLSFVRKTSLCPVVDRLTTSQ